MTTPPPSRVAPPAVARRASPVEAAEGVLLPEECSTVAAERTAGIDEAGRGCLAGPVVAAAVILPSHYDLPGLNDSKALSATQRAALAPAIRQCALAWGLGVVWQKDIDRVNILQATFMAMSRAVGCLRRRPRAGGCPGIVVPASPDAPMPSASPNHHPDGIATPPAPSITSVPAPLLPNLPLPALLLVDGNKSIPPPLLSARVEGPLPHQRAVVGGDALEPCISAASILAKTFRDAVMDALHKRYPVYGFLRHKGYGTKEHLAALRQHGPCPLHRMTFAGVLPPAPSAPSSPKKQGTLL